MDTSKRILPIGVQSFEKLIEDGNLYVDKTKYIYDLANTGTQYFLSRPRRFGKSLLLSTMKAYWEGKRELFRGLEIDKLEKDAWEMHPVFYVDLNKASYDSFGVIESVFEAHLKEWEAEYGTTSADSPQGVRFGQLLRRAFEKTGKRAVVLVDEYDKPLLETIENKKLIEHNKAVFKGFFSVLKSEDACIRFVFITGVTKFSKISIFSDLNQLRDISMNADYAEICGVTEDELITFFRPETEALANELGMSNEECLKKLKLTYDGYRFHHKGKGVYNPYSLLNAFADREFGSYWFETGTPTFLVERLRSINFDVRKFTDGTLYATRQMLMDYKDDDPDVVPLLYQTGYLTLSDYDPQEASYSLVFPNEEVEYGFLKCLLPIYVGNTGSGSGKDIITLKRYVEAGNLESIRKVFESLFASIPYTTKDDPFEHDFQTVIFITMTLLGQFVHCELHTYTGRIDCVLETSKFTYLFEFKRDAGADEALKQIEDKDYALPYASDGRKLFKIGVGFDSKTRKLAEWKVE